MIDPAAARVWTLEMGMGTITPIKMGMETIIQIGMEVIILTMVETILTMEETILMMEETTQTTMGIIGMRMGIIQMKKEMDGILMTQTQIQMALGIPGRIGDHIIIMVGEGTMDGR